MKRNLTTLLIVAGGFLLSADKGCKEKQVAESLYGTWKWEKTACCGRGMKITTDDENTDRTLVFNEGGKYAETKNGVVSKEGTFVVRKGINDYQLSTGDSADVVLFDENIAGYVTNQNDTLVISFGYMDLQTDYYTRKKK